MRIAFPGIALAVVAASASPAELAKCTISPSERAWVDGSLAAWRYMVDQRFKLAPAEAPVVIVFNDKCRFEAKAVKTPQWKGEAHRGTIRMPGRSDIPVGVASFAGHNDQTGLTYFVMALPPIWEAANLAKPGDWSQLYGVFLHEFAHTRQTSALKPAFDAAAAIQPLPDDLDDDGVQKKFGTDPAYRVVIEKEMDLLLKAAHEPSEAKAKALAREALELMDARQKRWFTGPDAIWKRYDDIFLTMEGFGQWTAYAWLSDPNGGHMSAQVAEDKMRGRKRWWSQEAGLSLYILIDRFVPNWPQRSFAASPAMGIDLLRQAVED